MKVNFTPKQIEVMIGILNVRNSEFLNFATLAREINVGANYPPFRTVISYLISAGIVEHRHTFGSSKLIEINHGKLCDLLDEQTHINFIVDKYLARHHVFV